MKTLLYATTTMTLLVAGHLSLTMADGPRASGSNTWGGGSLVSDTTSRTATTPSAVAHQTGNNALLLQQLDLMVEQRFLKPANRELVLTSGDAIELVSLMENCKVNPDEVWFRDRNLT